MLTSAQNSIQKELVTELYLVLNFLISISLHRIKFKLLKFHPLIKPSIDCNQEVIRSEDCKHCLILNVIMTPQGTGLNCFYPKTIQQSRLCTYIAKNISLTTTKICV